MNPMLKAIARPSFDDLNLSTGKRARLYHMMYEHGPANGTLMLLPIDQGLEHGPTDFFANPESMDTAWILRLAVAGRFSGIAYHLGLAEKYHRSYAGRVPLLLKINGKTSVPPDDAPFSALTASVDDAVRLGADAIGYTLYVGSAAQDRDIAQASDVRRQCERRGMPLVVWAYPRGSAIKEKGGQDSLYAIDYAARVATEIGADIIKLNVPKWDAGSAKHAPPPYDEMEFTEEEGLRKVVRSAGRSLVLVSGGDLLSDDDEQHKARIAMDAGCVGIIFGRNMWQRHWDDALASCRRMHELFGHYSSDSPT